MKIEKFFKENLSRQGFLRIFGIFMGLLMFNSRKSRKLYAASSKRLNPRKKRQIITECDLAVSVGKSPGAITRQAVDTLGGMKRFVKTGDTVVVKPNIGWDRSPEQAANTNPEIVAEIIKMCKESGAKTVKVFDNTCNNAKRTYVNSGIMDAARKEGAIVHYVDDWKFHPSNFPSGSLMNDWPMYKDAVECDCFINVPVAKDHGLTRLSLSMKNLMGVCGASRGRMHWNIDRKLAEVTNFINPDLNIVDAYRMLLRNGPTGGNLADVKLQKTVIASKDPVLADAYAATLFGIDPSNISHIKLASELGCGSMDIKKANIKKIVS
ncbi:DUF362 domain-containing protein [Elusimicrobiota bacterium]